MPTVYFSGYISYTLAQCTIAHITVRAIGCQTGCTKNRHVQYYVARIFSRDSISEYRQDEPRFFTLFLHSLNQKKCLKSIYLWMDTFKQFGDCLTSFAIKNEIMPFLRLEIFFFSFAKIHISIFHQTLCFEYEIPD